MLAGTPGYISPEQETSRQADVRNDIYSLGCILESMQLGKTYHAIIEHCKAPIARRYAKVGELLRDFLACQNKKHQPIKRYATIAMLCAIVLGSLSYTLYNREKDISTPTTTKQEAKATNTQLPTTKKSQQNKNDSLQKTSHAALGNMKQSAHPTTTDNLITKGKKEIDKMWTASSIDTLHAVIAKSQADGSVELGIFKNKISNNLLDNIKDVKNTEDIELYVGEKFNKGSERIGEVCMEFGSFEKAYASINKDLGTATGVNSDLMDKYTAQLKTKLVKKYGTKAYNAMANAHPYVGMPEGILLEFGYPTPDNFGNNKFIHAYGFSHTNVSGYKVYKKTIQYYALCEATHISTPQYIL